MLRNTFIHLRGFGPKKEKTLWELGIFTWDDFERRFLTQGTLFPSSLEIELVRALTESRDALDHDDCDYFARTIATRLAGVSIIGAIGLVVAIVGLGLTVWNALNTTNSITNSVRSEWDAAARSRLPLIDELSRKLDELKRSDDANEFRIRNLENAIASLKSEIAESRSTRIGRTKKR